MIEAAKRNVKAQLSSSTLTIQGNLVQLYNQNIANITSAALFAGFAFTIVTAGSTISSKGTSAFVAFLYYSLFMICFIGAFFVLSQATVVSTFGPEMALLGEESDSVNKAASLMREQQVYVYSICLVTVSSMFFGACVYCWLIYPTGLAVITTVFYLFGSYLAFQNAKNTFNFFASNTSEIQAYRFLNRFTMNRTMEEIAHQERLLAEAEKAAEEKEREREEGGGIELAPQVIETKSADLTVSMGQISDLQAVKPAQAIKMKARGVLWRRRSADEGGLFVKCYAVVRKGRVELFRSEEAYKNEEDPISAQPLQLSQYFLETDQRRIPRREVLGNSLNVALGGGGDFSPLDLLQSSYNLRQASLSFRFALLPRVYSELAVSESLELLAPEEESFLYWTAVLGAIIRGYDQLANQPSAEQNLRQGTVHLSQAVSTANTAKL